MQEIEYLEQNKTVRGDNMFKDKKLIIFDVDGTLIDSVGIWNEIDERLIRAIGDGTIDDVNIQMQRDRTLKEVSDGGDLYLRYCEFLKEKYKSNMTAKEILKLRYDISQDYMENIVDYKQDAEKVILRLKQLGFNLAIGSTTRKNNIIAYDTVNKNMMEKAKMNEVFDYIVAKEDVTKRKPKPEVHEKILKYFNMKPEEALIIEDSLLGVEAAQNAGIDVITIYDKYSDGDREEINKISKYNFLTFKEMLDYINKEFK